MTPSLVGVFLEPNSQEKCLLIVKRPQPAPRFEVEAAIFLIRVLRAQRIEKDCCNIYYDIEWREAVNLVKREIGKHVDLFLLREDGERASFKTLTSSKALFVLGSHVDPPETPKARRISIGSRSYLASHVVAFINYLYNKRAWLYTEQD